MQDTVGRVVGLSKPRSRKRMYQKDLGRKIEILGKAMKDYNPDPGCKKAVDQ
jgi:hypothetical protein